MTDKIKDKEHIPATPKPMTHTEARLRAMAEAMGVSSAQLQHPIFHNYLLGMHQVMHPGFGIPATPGNPQGIPSVPNAQLQQPTTSATPSNKMMEEVCRLIEDGGDSFVRQKFKSNVDSMKSNKPFPYDGSTPPVKDQVAPKAPPVKDQVAPKAEPKVKTPSATADIDGAWMNTLKGLQAKKDVQEALVDTKQTDQKTGPRIKSQEPGTKCSNPVPTRDLTDSVMETKRRTEGGDSGAMPDLAGMASQMMSQMGGKGGKGGGGGPPEQAPISGMNSTIQGGPGNAPKVGPSNSMSMEGGGNGGALPSIQSILPYKPVSTMPSTMSGGPKSLATPSPMGGPLPGTPGPLGDTDGYRGVPLGTDTKPSTQLPRIPGPHARANMVRQTEGGKKLKENLIGSAVAILSEKKCNPFQKEGGVTSQASMGGTTAQTPGQSSIPELGPTIAQRQDQTWRDVIKSSQDLKKDPNAWMKARGVKN